MVANIDNHATYEMFAELKTEYEQALSQALSDATELHENKLVSYMKLVQYLLNGEAIEADALWAANHFTNVVEVYDQEVDWCHLLYENVKQRLAKDGFNWHPHPIGYTKGE